MKIFKYIIIVISIKFTYCEWKLILNDEFDNEMLSDTNWVAEDEKINCNGNNINQLNCNTNREANLRVSNGALAIIAVKENYNNKNFTSAKITSRQNFTYGRIDIRAALPVGKLLRVSMAITSADSSDWPDHGHIHILTDFYKHEIFNTIHYYDKSPVEFGYKENLNLENFHTFSLQWNETRIEWFIDNTSKFHITLKESFCEASAKLYEPSEPSFKFQINMGVGGDYLNNDLLSLNDVNQWQCPLIIDYIRIFEKSNETHNYNFNADQNNAKHICKMMRNKFYQTNSTFTVLIFAAVILSIALIINFVLKIIYNHNVRPMNPKIKINTSYEELET